MAGSYDKDKIELLIKVAGFAMCGRRQGWETHHEPGSRDASEPWRFMLFGK